MTVKKELILEAALELFANQGYAATSTSGIAKKAGVSEGLLFKHFGSKKGLLDTLIDESEHRTLTLMRPIIEQKDPVAVIRQYIELPFSIPQTEYNFWRLVFQLKWDVNYNHQDKMKPLMTKLSEVFKVLGKENPTMEAEMLFQIIDNVAIGLLQGSLKQPDAFRAFLLKKYLG